MMSGRVLYIKNSSSKVNLNTYNVQAVGLGKAFCQLGYDYDFLFFSKEDRTIQEEEISGHKLRIITKKGIRLLRSYVCPNVLDPSYLSSYDFVISTEYGQIMTYLVSKKTQNVVLYSGPYYNLFKLPFVSPFYDLFFTKSINKNCKAKFVKSQLAKSYLEKKGYTDLHNIGVGLDTSRFEPKTDIQPSTQAIIDIMKNNRCLLYVGALSDRKNFPFQLKVYEKVVEKNPDVKFVVIGKGKKQYVQKHLKKLSEKAQKGICMFERIDNAQLQFVYPLAKAFMLPSKLEIFGMVLLESMYFGAPVVTSWNGGSSTLIYNKQTGQIVKDFDAVQWADAIQRYLDDDVYLRRTTELAKEEIEQRYNWLAIASSMLKQIKGNE